MPIVWINGIVAALAILLSYLAFNLHPIAGAITGVIFLLAAPFFFAGTYGMILDGNKKKRTFLLYARYGYPRCLLPTVLITLVCLLLTQFTGTIGAILSILILYFTYFSDITAIRHNLTTGQAIKDSAQRALGGSLLVLGFYLANIIAVILMSLVLDLITGAFFSATGAETTLLTILQPLTSDPANLQTALTSNPEILIEMGNQILASPEIMLSLVFSSAIVALLFMPFFVAYKACFFKDLIAAQAAAAAAMKAAQEKAGEEYAQNAGAGDANSSPADAAQNPENPAEQPFSYENQPERPQTRQTYDPHAGEDGEYDSKGRWFKYK